METYTSEVLNGKWGRMEALLPPTMEMSADDNDWMFICS